MMTFNHPGNYRGKLKNTSIWGLQFVVQHLSLFYNISYVL